MDPADVAGDHGAYLLGAECHDGVHSGERDVGQPLGPLPRDVDADLGERRYGQRMQRARRSPSAIWLRAEFATHRNSTVDTPKHPSCR